MSLRENKDNVKTTSHRAEQECDAAATEKEETVNKNVVMDQEEPEEEELDPRVQEELEKLNQCTDKINDLELQLEEANAVFRTLLSGK